MKALPLHRWDVSPAAAQVQHGVLRLSSPKKSVAITQLFGLEKVQIKKGGEN